MKLIDIPSFDGINAALREIDGADVVISGRLELFSCKSNAAERKEMRNMERDLAHSYSKSFEDTASALHSTPFGALDDLHSRRTFVFLVNTLNAAYPDYDFSNLSPCSFRKEASVEEIVEHINELLGQNLPGFREDGHAEHWWRCIDENVDLSDVKVFSYNADDEPDADPLWKAGKVWSFNYFFFSQQLRRVLLFTCRALSKDSLRRSSLLAMQSSGASVDANGLDAMLDHADSDGERFLPPILGCFDEDM